MITMSDTNSAELTLGYLGWREMSDTHAYIGGLLVINEEGFPLEFRCTEPIRPNVIQLMLYGASLRQFIFRELMGHNLWEHLSIRPKLLFICKAQLWCIQDKLPVPVAHLSLTDQSGELVEVADLDAEIDSFLVSTPQGDQIAVTLMGKGTKHATECRDLIGRCARKMDIYEPFSRVAAVLERLEKRTPRKQ